MGNYKYADCSVAVMKDDRASPWRGNEQGKIQYNAI